MSILEYFPMISDVKDSYRKFREKGYGREEAIEKLRAEYANELRDSDDGPQVRIGLAEVTGRRKEMTEELLRDAEAAFSALEIAFPEARSALRAKKKTVCDPSKLGPEAKYRKKTIYRPDWQIGDTFAYQIKGDAMKAAGLEGWYIICRKVREIVLAEDCCLQGMYYSLCPPNAIPATKEALEKMGYVPLLKMSDTDYLFMGRVWVNSRSEENMTFFKKIGNFQHVARPDFEFDFDSDPHTNSDQYPMYIDGAYFWYLEKAVLHGYLKHGIKPAVK